MPGANNSASGVALLLETARVLAKSQRPNVGIDMIFFDGEEGPKSLGAGDPTWHPLGSPYFVAASEGLLSRRSCPRMRSISTWCATGSEAAAGAVIDASARPEVTKFWTIGSKLAPGAFAGKSTPYAISDDHTALQEAGIPSFLVIDFDYEPYFNTTQDTIDKCSVDSLQTVGRTLLQYLYAQ